MTSPRPHRERRAAAGARARSRSCATRPWRSLARLAAAAIEYDDLAIAGRSHNVAAQMTTLGKRFASAADELLVAHRRVEELIARYPLRGIKGPVGTAQDMLDLLDGDTGKLDELEDRVAAHLGFDHVFDQRRPGLPALARLRRRHGARAARRRPVVVRDHVRLMAGNELVTEGFKPGQVGSSAMPHKMNSPLLRARQRLRGDPARLRLDGRRARRRAVERGRRLLLRRTPRRAARRVLRDRRPARDVPDGARRVRRVPRRRRARAAPLPAVPRHDQGAHRRGARTAWAARPRTRRSRSTPSPSRSRCARRAPRATTCSTASPPTRASASPATQLDALVAEPIEFTGAARAQVTAVADEIEHLVAERPDAAVYKPEPIL